MIQTHPFPPPRTMAQLREEAAHIQSLPQFPEALGTYIVELANYREASRPFGKLIANEDRYRVVNFICAMWAELVAAGGSGAMTYGQLFEICRRGEVTPRILKTTLSLATFSGFLKKSPNPDDRRSWLYLPTPLMMEHPFQWGMANALPLDQLLPGKRRVERMQRHNRDDVIHLLRSAGREFAAGVQPMTVQLEFMEFWGHKEGAALFSLGLLSAEARNLPRPSRAELAIRFGLSKSQITHLVAMGRELGLYSIEDGEVVPTDLLREQHAEFAALCLVFLEPHMLGEE
jgi:hypothetical protein